MTWSTRSPSDTMTGGSASALQAVVDLAAARLLGERAVRMIQDATQVDLLVADGEPVRLELREIEHVSHQPLEAVGLRRDDVERGLTARAR